MSFQGVAQETSGGDAQVQDLCRDVSMSVDKFRSTRRRFSVKLEEQDGHAFGRLKQCLEETKAVFAEERRQLEIENAHTRELLAKANATIHSLAALVREGFGNTQRAPQSRDESNTVKNPTSSPTAMQAKLQEMALKKLHRVLGSRQTHQVLAALFSWHRGMFDAGREYAAMLEEQIDTMEGMVREAAEVRYM